MNKIFLGIAIVAAIAIAWFILNPGDTFDYVATVDSEITKLENELADIEAQVAAGTLSEEQATEAKVKIVTRLDAINTATSNSERAQLTPAQRTQLVDGLERLKVILITYQGTLATVEANANETQVQSRVRRGGSYTPNRPLNLIVADVIADVEVTVEDSVSDYEANTELEVAIEEIVTEIEAEIEAEAATESEDDSAIEDDAETTQDQDVSDDQATTSDEAEPMLDAEVSAEAELGATTTIQ